MRKSNHSSPGPAAASSKKYQTILMDPPWPIKWNAASSIGKKNLQYQTLPISEIIAIPVDELAAEHCRLLMWVTNSFLPEGLGIIRLWKFHYDKLFTWCKNNGMGGHPRNATEHLIIASRGEPQMRGRNDSMILNWLECPRTSKHSEKPDALRHVFEKFSPEPRIELFARQRHPGWDAWGNEMASDVDMKVGSEHTLLSV